MFEEGLTPHTSAGQPCWDPSILLLACGEKIGEMNFLPHPDTSCLVGDPLNPPFPLRGKDRRDEFDRSYSNNVSRFFILRSFVRSTKGAF